MLSLCAVIPLIIVILAYLFGLAIRQYQPTSNVHATAYLWCVIFAVIWLIYSLVATHVIH